MSYDKARPGFSQLSDPHLRAKQAKGIIAVTFGPEIGEGEGGGRAGAIGRGEFFAIAAAEVARARRYGNSLSCLVIAVDRLVSVDERHNGALPAPALEHIISVCRTSLRASDYIGRIGDDEFAVILPETPVLGALGAAERILENLATSTGEIAQHCLEASTSIGVAEYEEQTWSLDQLLQAAEAAMAIARQSGRNHAVCYLDDLQLTSTVARVN